MPAAGTWGEYRYRVEATVAATPAIRELRLAPTGDVLAYRAGQYVLLGDPGRRLPQRSYSIANAPRADGRISLLVTRFPDGPVSGWVHGRLRVDDEVLLAGPYGTFLPGADSGRPVLLLAAGSGLAPVRALAEDLLERHPARRVALFHSVRTAEHAIDRARFETWPRTYPSFRFLLTLTRDPSAARHRRIPELLRNEFADLRGWDVFASGPSGFVAACAAAARAAGADAAAVRTEEFFADPQPWLGAPPPAPAASAAP